MIVKRTETFRSDPEGLIPSRQRRSPPAGSKPCTCAATSRVKVRQRVPKLRVSPEISQCRSLRRPHSGGSTSVTVRGEGTSVRPGSWNGAKAQEGSSEDLRDPIRVHTQEAGTTGGRLTKGPGLEGTLRSSGSATANTKQEGPCGQRKRNNKRPWIRGWEVVAPS
jgi:hypothetical protein